METNFINKPEKEAPWLGHYGNVPFHLDYPDCSIADMVLSTAEREGKFPALSYKGKLFSYNTLREKIDAAAAGFVALGIKKRRCSHHLPAECASGGLSPLCA